MTREEHETHILYDYAGDTVNVYTTRKGVFNQLRKRLEPVWDEVRLSKRRNDGRTVAWDLSIPQDYCSPQPATIAKTANQISKS